MFSQGWIDRFGSCRQEWGCEPRAYRWQGRLAICTGLLSVVLSNFSASGQTIEVLPGTETVFTFSGFEGGPFLPEAPAVWTVDIGDIGESSESLNVSTLDYTIGSSQPWLRPTPAVGVLLGSFDGSGAARIEAMLDDSEAESLSAGVYSATITFTNITAGLGGTTRTVNLHIAPASFSTSPAFVNASATVNGSDPPPLTVTLTSSGWPALNYELTWDQRSWFTVDKTNGTVPGRGTDSFDVSFNVFGLGAGVYTSEIAIENTSNGAGSRVIPITLVVYPSGAGAVIMTPSSDIEIRGRTGGLDEIAKLTVLTNHSDEDVRWNAAASDEWVSVAPSAGELAASDGVAGGADEQPVEIRVNAARQDLPAGSHTATVTFKQTAFNAVTGETTGVPFGTRLVRVIADPVLEVSVPLAGGEVTVSPSGESFGGATQGDVVLGFGDVVTLTAVVADGFQFDGWVADFEIEAELENPLVVTMDSSTRVAAVFVPIPRTLTLSTSGDGTGTITASPTGTFVDNALVASYNNGAEVELTATPDAGSAFGGWAGNIPEGLATTNPLIVVMDRERTITARFVPGLVLTVEVTGDGEVAVDPDQAAYAPGTTVTLTATPAEGSMFVRWGGDETGTELATTVTVNENMVVEALFAADDGSGDTPPDDDDTDPNIAKLIVNIEGDGVVTPSGGDYAIGARVTLIATPGVGSRFVGWEDDAQGSELTATITMDADRTALAVFEPGEDPADRPDPGSGSGQLCGAMGILGMPMLLLGFATLTRLRSCRGRRTWRTGNDRDFGETS